MIAILQIIFSILFLVAFRGSVTSLIRGSDYPLTSTSPGGRQLDNVYRFMAGVYLGVSILCAWMVFSMNEQRTLVYLVALMVFLAGMGRVISIRAHGIFDRRFAVYAIAEWLLSILIVVINFFRHP
jgi:hypothetical protein